MSVVRCVRCGREEKVASDKKGSTNATRDLRNKCEKAGCMSKPVLSK